MGGFANNAPIVTDGLVFYVDAGNGNSYPGSGTTWTDLVGGNDGTLTNGPTYSSDNGGSIVFDGTNDYCDTNYDLPAQSSTTTFSWNLWIRLNSGGDGNEVIFGNRHGTSGGGSTQFIKITPTKWEYHNGGGDNLNYTIPLNQWVNVCLVKNQGTHYYYSNGSQVATRSSTKSVGSIPVFIGDDGAGGITNPANVNFSSAAIYEKALSASEVLQNYNALKNRFV